MILAALLLLQDAAPLPPVVESWYRLEREGRHAGWMRETFRPGVSWTRDVVDGPRTRHDAADLRNGAVRLRSTRGDDESSLDWTPDRPIASLRAFGGGALDVRQKTPALPLELTLYALRSDGRLAAPGRFAVRLLDLEGEAPSLPELPLEVGSLLEVEAFGRRPRMTSIAFPDACPGLGYVEVRVDRFGRIFDGRLHDGTRLRLVKDETEAVGELPRPATRDRGFWGKELPPAAEKR